MRVFTIERRQRLKVSREEAYRFISNPALMGGIIPADLGLQVLNHIPDRVYEGLLLHYRLKPLFGVPVHWLGEITYCDEPSRFVDEQRLGPFAFWHHEHRLREIPGGVEMSDLIHYAVPFGPLGSVVNTLVLGPRLRRIFDYRESALARKFGSLP
jgi:ligand-binding SRPBCC domain-containing protein